LTGFGDGVRKETGWFELPEQGVDLPGLLWRAHLKEDAVTQLYSFLSESAGKLLSTGLVCAAQGVKTYLGHSSYQSAYS
jgi:hypothetical protein